MTVHRRVAAERRNAMDASMIRIVCAAMAVLLLAVIVMRRRKRTE